MGKQPGNALAKLDDYEQRGGFNVLHPVVQVEEGAISPVLVGSISVRQLKVDQDTYNDFRFANPREGKYALNGHALQKLAADAGIRWVEPAVVEERERLPGSVGVANHVYIRVRSTGAVLQPNGETYLISAHKEIDTADLAEQYAVEVRKKAKREKRSVSDEDVEAAVRERILQVREHVLSLAETKAQFRVVRKLLTLKQVYTKEELARPFVVPRLLVRPEAAEAIEHGRAAAKELYGGSPVVPTGQEAPPSPSSSAEEPQRERSGEPAEATGQTADPAEAGAPEAEAAAGPEPPSDDPIIEDPGPHKGERMSYVTEIDPGYMRGVAASGRTKKLRELASAWLAYHFPSLPESE